MFMFNLKTNHSMEYTHQRSDYSLRLIFFRFDTRFLSLQYYEMIPKHFSFQKYRNSFKKIKFLTFISARCLQQINNWTFLHFSKIMSICSLGQICYRHKLHIFQLKKDKNTVFFIYII